MQNDTVRTQYEAYPYPARDPADEARRLVVGSPSHLHEMTHWLFGGHLPRGRPFRVLVAGGGTGDGLVMLAQQLADAGVEAEITYIDLSEAARDIAEARIAARGLSDLVDFRIGSLLEAGEFGPFDYIDCCGVLHHLPEPEAGFRALREALAPEGGMGMMVYGAHGRTGVYDLQRVLADAAPADLPPAERVAIARAFLKDLPATNRFRRNPLLRDHMDNDAGLYDLLLHTIDRAYRAEELMAVFQATGWRLVTFIDPLRYAPETYLGDKDALARAAALPPDRRIAMAEDLAGNMRKHICYLVRDDRVGETAPRLTPESVPVFRDEATMASFRAMPDGATEMPLRIDGLDIAVPLPKSAKAILDQVDGRRPLSRIKRRAKGVSAPAFDRDAPELFRTLTGFSKAFLKTTV